jgi:hypothetical protein
VPLQSDVRLFVSAPLGYASTDAFSGLELDASNRLAKIKKL